MRRISILGVAAALGLLASAQAPSANAAPKVITPAQYRQAERWLGYNTAKLVYGLNIRPGWLPDGRMWFEFTTPQGNRYVLVNPARATREPAFDAVKLAAALARASGRRVAPGKLALSTLAFSRNGRDVSFTSFGKRWRCDRLGAACSPDARPAPIEPGGGRGFGGRGFARVGANAKEPLAIAPNRKWAVFIRHWNLWMRNLATHQDTQLTFDGVKNYGYATDNAGWTASNRAIVNWSPDSTKIATFQQDQRRVGKLYLVPVMIGHPKLTTQIYPLPGDKHVIMIHRVIIDLPVHGHPLKVVRLQMPPDYHRSTISDNLAFGPNQDVQWSPGARHLAFISTSRDHKDEHLRVANASTGAVRTVYEEKVATQYEGGQDGTTFRYLPRLNAFIWYSHRENLGQLFLYNLTTGKLIHQITSLRDGNVDSVVRVDQKAREVYFIATALPGGGDPYYQHLFRASLDGRHQQLLTPENANHNIDFSPDGRYFLDTFSTPDIPPVTVLRASSGKLVMRLEKADISRLLATGWKPPIQVRVKGRDGRTDIYGLMYTPFHLDPGRKYPIINHIYPGPQTGSVGTRNFEPSRYDCEALASLGFVVVELDGMGTPWRGEKFHDTYYGNMRDNTLPDQVIGMKELAARYPFIDIDKAGIYGHSGGGDATADAMFRYPNFFKVGVAESGNHDQREYEDDWGERYMGLDLPTANGKTTYSGQSNEGVAKNLKGHLLLAHGTMDNNVPINNTLMVVNALIAANKNFSLILFPNKPHAYGTDAPYMMRRRWDYFVRYLMGARPPHEFLMQTPPARGN
jgi:dipeptidyl-peptidase-4